MSALEAEIRITEEEARPKAIDEAYEELSQEAFATWMRLMVIPGQELQKGRTNLSKVLGIHRQSLNRYLRELNTKEYVSLVRRKGQVQTEIVLAKVAMYIQPSHFVSY